MARLMRIDLPVIMPDTVAKVEYAEDFATGGVGGATKLVVMTTIRNATTFTPTKVLISEGDIPTVDVTETVGTGKAGSVNVDVTVQADVTM